MPFAYFSEERFRYLLGKCRFIDAARLAGRQQSDERSDSEDAHESARTQLIREAFREALNYGDVRQARTISGEFKKCVSLEMFERLEELQNNIGVKRAVCNRRAS